MKEKKETSLQSLKVDVLVSCGQQCTCIFYGSYYRAIDVIFIMHMIAICT